MDRHTSFLIRTASAPVSANRFAERRTTVLGNETTALRTSSLTPGASEVVFSTTGEFEGVDTITFPGDDIPLTAMQTDGEILLQGHLSPKRILEETRVSVFLGTALLDCHSHSLSKYAVIISETCLRVSY